MGKIRPLPLWGFLLLSAWVSLATLTKACAAHAGENSCKVMFVPGAFGGDDAVSGFFIREDEYFSEYRAYFQSKKCTTTKAILPPDLTIEERALLLRDQAMKFSPDFHSLILIAHSEGGLDARFGIKTLKMQEVRALLSVGVPHLGTPLASWVLRQRESQTFAYWVFRILFRYDFKSLRFAGEFTPDFLKQHHNAFEAVPGVYYASAQAVCLTGCHPLLRVLSKWIPVPSGDGIIPGDAQHFGEELGQFNLDHISTVGIDAGKAKERLRLLDRLWKSSRR